MSLYVDGCMNKDTGKEAWASVVDSDNKDMVSVHQILFTDLVIKKVSTPKGEYYVAVAKFSDVSSQQNNGAELLATVMALRICTSPGQKYETIYSDSTLILDWWSKGKVNKKTLSKMDDRKKGLISECKQLREQFESSGGEFGKISGAANPADLGYHK